MRGWRINSVSEAYPARSTVTGSVPRLKCLSRLMARHWVISVAVLARGCDAVTSSGLSVRSAWPDSPWAPHGEEWWVSSDGPCDESRRDLEEVEARVPASRLLERVLPVRPRADRE